MDKIDIAAGALRYVQWGEHHDLTLRQIALLAILNDRLGPHGTADLAARIRVDKVVISRSIATFERFGLAEQVRNPLDKRKRIITITDAGKAVREGFRLGGQVA